jgi:hypothetical protein
MQRFLIGLITLACFMCAPRGAAAQDDGQPLIDMPPFDVIVLTQAAGGKSVKIAPLPQRNYDKRPADTERLQVVLLSHPERKYEILWRDIEKLNLYERMVYDDAMKKLGEKDFIAAFMNLSFLMQNYPKTPNLENSCFKVQRSCSQNRARTLVAIFRRCRHSRNCTPQRLTMRTTPSWLVCRKSLIRC